MTDECLLDPDIRENCIIIFCNTGKENDATLDFVHLCDAYWRDRWAVGVAWLEYNPDAERKFDIVDFATAHRTADASKLSPFEKLIIEKKYVPNIMARFCTQEMKVRTIKRYMESLNYAEWTNVVGIRYDEPNRWAKRNNVVSKEKFDVWMPMVEWRTTKPHVKYFWKNHMPFDLEIENDYEGNCDLCFLKGIGKKRAIIRKNPEKADWWIRMEEMTGATFKARYSVKSIVDKIRKQPEFAFEEDGEPDFECFCNID